ncbi:hypothetical protein [Amycolatopsis sp. H20-H5]|uniref:hypothetical protein n=1 Tax=Amycolatopsis sp. H20-H5 TaxID=3046309 RepID=UPI002DBADC99|nr:hypothetical protein [Amycolatopsis sp. H20-H5]MEC3973941.1 hypothetical protein [Amycolatopsis sp. H20-H5]
MLSTPPESRVLVVLADHGQFYLQDLDAHDRWMRTTGAHADLPPAGWTAEAVNVHRIGVEPHSLSIGTARSDHVETTLRFCESAPPLDPEAEHSVEADLELLGDDLAIYGPADDPGREQHVPATAGGYRVRVSYVPSEPPALRNEHEAGDYFHYAIDLWPRVTPTALEVLKQGPDPW